MTALLFNPSAAGVGSGDFTHALSRRVGGYTVGILSSDIIGYPSLAPTKPGHADASSVMPGMESDYYNKVWVIPDLIEVRNPPIGVPQEFGIWNACLEQNEILNVVEDDTTGLEVSAEAGDVYKRLQLIRYSITLTPLAPIEIDASYIFNFLIGAGELTFKASRAVVLYEPAEAPLKQVYEWKTDVIRAYDGQEQRVLVRPKPRCNLEYKIVFTSDAKIRAQRANLFTSISSPMVFPLWHEAFLVVAGKAIELKSLGGRTASLTTFDGLPLLDIRPLNNSLVDDAFTINSEEIDFGNVYSVYASQAFPRISGQREYVIRSRQELQFFKLFLDTVAGQSKPFYCPSFREDLRVAVQPEQGSFQFDIFSEEQYAQDWYGSDAHKTLMLTTADGARQPRKVTSAVDNQDGTTTIIVDTPLPDTVLGSTIASIEYMPKVRLGEDKVTFTHYGAYSKLELNIKTVEE
jgi:hypothetical protein